MGQGEYCIIKDIQTPQLSTRDTKWWTHLTLHTYFNIGVYLQTIFTTLNTQLFTDPLYLPSHNSCWTNLISLSTCTGLHNSSSIHLLTDSPHHPHVNNSWRNHQIHLHSDVCWHAILHKPMLQPLGGNKSRELRMVSPFTHLTLEKLKLKAYLDMSFKDALCHFQNTWLMKTLL